MQRKFAENMNELRGLINEWSALPCNVSDEGCSGEAGILLAVSGGIDSMCMAELFAALEPSVPFAVAHCNFNLRGEESDGDEALAREWAEGHNVRFHSKSFDTKAYASAQGISIEMAARDLRYGWFAELCREFGYKAVAVAHNSNDNAETLILNLLRGSGLNGLSGMSKMSMLPTARIPLIRPLLDCSRKQIEGYMFAVKAGYRDDSTNASSDYKRNRIRNEVFPIFETVNPAFVRTLNREMGYLAEAGEIVREWCRTAAPSVLRSEALPLRIGIDELMSVKYWKYLLYYMLEPFGFNSSTLSSIESLLVSSRTISGKRFDSQQYALFTDRDELVVLPKDHVVSVSGNTDIMPVRGAGVYHFNGRSFSVEILDRTPDLSLRQPEGVVMLDADKLRFPFVLRCWRDGDWLVPFGMKGKKKVSDLFTDLKYDFLQKGSAVMIVDTRTEGMAESQHLAAVAGVRIDDRYKVTDTTESVVMIKTI